MTLNEQLNQLVGALPAIKDTRKYWLIRTQSGYYYESFLNNGFVALEYDKAPVDYIAGLMGAFKRDEGGFKKTLRKLIGEVYAGSEPKKVGIITSQIKRFAYDINEDDIVIIPSENSTSISFGRVKSSSLRKTTTEEIIHTGCPFTLRKSVDWIKTVYRDNLDPYLYRVFLAHQALNNLRQYAEVIERTINNFFLFNEECHIVLDVKQDKEIGGNDLFLMGANLLQLVDEIANDLALDVSSSDINIKLNLNSPGKLDFFSKKMKSIVILGIAVLFVNGGGLHVGKQFDLSTPGIVKTITDYLNAQQDRELREKMLDKYMDSLKVQNPSDLQALLQQVSTNKNLPK